MRTRNQPQSRFMETEDRTKLSSLWNHDMKYISSHGKISYYKSEPTMVRRTIQMDSDYAEAYEATDLMDVIWEIAGNLVQEVKAQPVYHTPEGKIRRAYDLYIFTGVKILFGKTAINKMIMEIETELQKRLKIKLIQRHTIGKETIPNFSFSYRTKLRTEAQPTPR